MQYLLLFLVGVSFAYGGSGEVGKLCGYGQKIYILIIIGIGYFRMIYVRQAVHICTTDSFA